MSVILILNKSNKKLIKHLGYLQRIILPYHGELLLKLFVGVVDAELLKAVNLERLKSATKVSRAG